MGQEYTFEDEFNFIAWIASNGTMDHLGRVKTNEEIESDGEPKSRLALARIDLLNKYAESWKTRRLPEFWTEQARDMVLEYIFYKAIPMVKEMRQIQLGDLV